MDQHVLLFLIGQILTAAGVYAAIRADLREALIRMREAERRLDRLETDDRRHEQRRHHNREEGLGT
jgi:hypothetical protein